jgi:hypothetical protein
MENKHSKFLLLGATAGLVNTARVLHNMGEKVNDITTKAIISTPLKQKAILAFSNPANMNFMQRNPGLTLLGIAATAGITLGNSVYVALKGMNSPNEEKHNSISKKILELRDKFLEQSNNNENGLRI